MKLLGAVALSAFVVAIGSANAADMAVKAAPVVRPVPMYDWNGFYVGGHGGGAFGRSEWTENNYCIGGACAPISPPLGLPAAPVGHTQMTGALAGIQGGYNFSTGRFLFGVEGSWAWTNLKGDHDRVASLTGAPGGVVVQATDSNRYTNAVNQLATLTGRLGLSGGAENRLLWYVKGGAAWQDVSYTVNQGVTGISCVGGCLAGAAAGTFTSATKSRWGYVVGTGVEYSLFDGWTAKIEYNYMDFGNEASTYNGAYSTLTGCFAAGTCVLPGTVVPGGAFTRNYSNSDKINTITVGLNYKFGGPGAVVAKY